MIIIRTLALAIIAATVAGCTSSRFAIPPPPQAAPQAAAPQPVPKARPTDGPYTREREDQEFGQPR
jgi:hypothetical protein